MSRRTPRRAPSCGPRSVRGAVRWRLIALLAGLAFVFGCAEANPLPSPGSDTGIPNGRDEPGGQPVGDGDDVPEPPADQTGYIRSELTYVSSLAREETEGTVVLVGAPGSVSTNGTLRLVVPGLGLDVPLTPDTGGAFATQIDGATEGLSLRLEFYDVPDETDSEDAAELLTDLELVVRKITDDDPTFYFDENGDDSFDGTAGAGDPDWGRAPSGGNGEERSGFITVTAPDANGDVHVRSANLGATPYVRVVVLNTADGRPYVGNVSSEGAVDLVLPAQAGDVLRVFAASPNDPESTTQAIQIVVPGA